MTPVLSESSRLYTDVRAPPGILGVFWRRTLPPPPPDMLIDAFQFLWRLCSRLSGELPWEFNSGCDQRSADKTRAQTRRPDSSRSSSPVKDERRCQVKELRRDNLQRRMKKRRRSGLKIAVSSSVSPQALLSPKCSSFTPTNLQQVLLLSPLPHLFREETH